MFGRFCFPVTGGCDAVANGPSGTVAAIVDIICRNDRRFIDLSRLHAVELGVCSLSGSNAPVFSCFERMTLTSCL